MGKYHSILLMLFNLAFLMKCKYCTISADFIFRNCLYEIDGREETEASLPLYKEELIYVQAIYSQNQPTDNIKVT